VACFYRHSGGKPEHFTLPPSMFAQFYAMRHEAVQADPAAAWSTLTFILEHDGKFHVDHGYDPASVEGMFARRMAWRARYLES
jgi:hypothetical protein